ncbi:hypothetical protein ACLX1H_009330 [Fusarium chlamydosporum]
MSHPTDTSARHVAGDSPDDVAPTKPPARVLDIDSLSHAACEDDLNNGPLLLGLGHGHEDLVFPYPGPNLGSQDSGYQQPEASILPLMPLRLLEVSDTGPVTSSSISQSGPSLTEPTESNSAAGQSMPGEPDGMSVVEDRGIHPSSWEYKFSWGENGLYFGEELLKVVTTTEDRFSKVDPGSERVLSQLNEPATELQSQGILNDDSLFLNIIGLGGFAEDLSSTTSLSLLDDCNTVESCDSFTDIAMYKSAEWIASLLFDDFYRSCVLQGSKRRAAGSSQQDVEQVSNDKHSGRQSMRSRAKPMHKKRKSLGDQEESEDDDPQGKKRKTPETKETEPSSPRWACPFQKWKPIRYFETCMVNLSVGPATIGGLVGHIKRVHVRKHCPKCWALFPNSHDEENHLRICPYVDSKPRPAGLVTKDMQLQMTKPRNRKVSHITQWYELYDLLFPGEQRPRNPFFSRPAAEHLREAKTWFCDKSLMRKLHQVMLEEGLGPERQNEHERIVYRFFLAMTFSEYQPNDEDLLTTDRNGAQVIEAGPVQASDADRTMVDTAPGSQACPQSYNEAPIPSSFPCFNLEETSSVIPELPKDGPVCDNTMPSTILDTPELVEATSDTENAYYSAYPEGTTLNESCGDSFASTLLLGQFATYGDQLAMMPVFESNLNDN